MALLQPKLTQGHGLWQRRPGLASCSTGQYVQRAARCGGVSASSSIVQRLLHPAELKNAEELHQAADRMCAAVSTCPSQPVQRFILSCLINHHPLLRHEYGDYSMPVNQIESLLLPAAKELVDLPEDVTVHTIFQAAQLQLSGAGLVKPEKDSSNVQCLQLQVDRLQQSAAIDALRQACANTSPVLLAGMPQPPTPYLELDQAVEDEGLIQQLSTDMELLKAACDILLPANSPDYLVQMKRQTALFLAALPKDSSPAGPNTLVKWAYMAHRVPLVQIYRKVRQPGQPQWSLPVFEGDPLFLVDRKDPNASKTAREQGAAVSLSWRSWAAELEYVAQQKVERVPVIKRSVQDSAALGSPRYSVECNMKAARGTPLTRVLTQLGKKAEAYALKSTNPS